MSILNKVRQWIDGDTSELVLEQAARDAQIKPRSKAEEFIVKIARAVEAVMQSEMVPLPQGTTIIPSEYIIFLNPDDDKEWQGAKRKGLEQGLYHILAERAKEIAGRRKLETKSFVIELRIDGTLQPGDIRVQHSWEDADANKTGVFARPKSLPQIDMPLPRPPIGQSTDPKLRAALSDAPMLHVPKTISGRNVQQAVPIIPEDGEEMTAVKSRARLDEIYKLEIWRNGQRQNVVPIYLKEITVGRGSKSKPVDISLAGDVEISRRHLTIVTDAEGKFWAFNEGKNPAVINNFELPAGQKVALTVGVPITICSYMLRILTN